MLKIWYYANIDYMKDAPSYFDNVWEKKDKVSKKKDLQPKDSSKSKKSTAARA